MNFDLLPLDVRKLIFGFLLASCKVSTVLARRVSKSWHADAWRSVTHISAKVSAFVSAAPYLNYAHDARIPVCQPEDLPRLNELALSSFGANMANLATLELPIINHTTRELTGPFSTFVASLPKLKSLTCSTHVLELLPELSLITRINIAEGDASTTGRYASASSGPSMLLKFPSLQHLTSRGIPVTPISESEVAHLSHLTHLEVGLIRQLDLRQLESFERLIESLPALESISVPFPNPTYAALRRPEFDVMIYLRHISAAQSPRVQSVMLNYPHICQGLVDCLIRTGTALNPEYLEVLHGFYSLPSLNLDKLAESLNFATLQRMENYLSPLMKRYTASGDFPPSLFIKLCMIAYQDIDEILKEGVDANMTNATLHYRTGLMFCPRPSPHVSCTVKLIQHGANALYVAPDGSSVLAYAMTSKLTFPTIVREHALDLKSMVFGPAQGTVLHSLACLKNADPEVENLRQVLDLGVDINAVDLLGRTALVVALQGPASESLISKLLSNGADPNITDNQGISPLRYAPWTSVACSLINSGARYDEPNPASGTTFMDELLHSFKFDWIYRIVQDCWIPELQQSERKVGFITDLLMQVTQRIGQIRSLPMFDAFWTFLSSQLYKRVAKPLVSADLVHQVWVTAILVGYPRLSQLNNSISIKGKPVEHQLVPYICSIADQISSSAFVDAFQALVFIGARWGKDIDGGVGCATVLAESLSRITASAFWTSQHVTYLVNALVVRGDGDHPQLTELKTVCKKFPRKDLANAVLTALSTPSTR